MSNNINEKFCIQKESFIFPLYIIKHYNILQCFVNKFFPLQINNNDIYYMNHNKINFAFLGALKDNNLIGINLNVDINYINETFSFLINNSFLLNNILNYINDLKEYWQNIGIKHSEHLKNLYIDTGIAYKNPIEYDNNQYIEGIIPPQLENYINTIELNKFFSNPLSELYLIKICEINNIQNITFFPSDDEVRIRVRYLGFYYDFLIIKNDSYLKITHRLKQLANLDLLDSISPQSGFMEYHYGLEINNCRVSFHPLITGEKISIRILNNYYINLNKLNLHPEISIMLESIILQRKIIFIGGLAGTGKTTLAYCLLNRLSNLGYHVISIEDPIEYKIPNIEQSSNGCVNNNDLLISSLRHDIDYLFVGEIRDDKMAKTVYEATATGHGVITTIHIGNYNNLKNRWLNLSNNMDYYDSIGYIIFPQIFYKIENCNTYKSTMILEIYDQKGNLISIKKEEQKAFFIKNNNNNY